MIVNDTIVAPATPLVCSGVGIIRVSGNLVQSIADVIIEKLPKPRTAVCTHFFDSNKAVIDEGLALYFKKPNSFTGEDVLELHSHGSPVVMDLLVRQCILLGARLANPGEFSERAFLNGKIDLTQAEAIADLINASSEQAAHSAILSLQGEFSKRIKSLVEILTNLRVFIEAEIDFSGEDIEFLSSDKIKYEISCAVKTITDILIVANKGRLLRDGIRVAIIGKPNVGKSSLLNYFCGHDAAIVTAIPGTTRDVLREFVNLDGLPLHIIDTAGICSSGDIVEQEGIKRSWQEIAKADLILLVVDTDIIDLSPFNDFINKIVVVRNKIDLINCKADIGKIAGNDAVYISVKNTEGLGLLENLIKSKSAFKDFSAGIFTSRRRHIDALIKANKLLQSCLDNLPNNNLELIAEDLRLTQNALAEITGEVHSEDLLGRIFSDFCIGK